MQEFKEISDLILEHNNQFIVAQKPAGLPCVPDKSEDKNLKNLLEAYSKHDLFIINRIDRPVSGLCLFAKNGNAANLLSEQLRTQRLEKSYLAIVEGKVEQKKKSLENFLIKGKGNKAIVVDAQRKDAKKATLHYEVVKMLDNYSILSIKISSGRYHQIRCQLAHMGHPIKGDVKYGARRKNRDRSIYLHAHTLAFYHPVTNEKCSFVKDPDPQDPLWSLMD